MAKTLQPLTAVDAYTGPDLYYYEVIECGRRMLLTGVLVFIAPHTATQVAMACVFAFASILGFELMRPHMDPTDSWLYRLVSRHILRFVMYLQRSRSVVSGVLETRKHMCMYTYVGHVVAAIDKSDLDLFFSAVNALARDVVHHSELCLLDVPCLARLF